MVNSDTYPNLMDINDPHYDINVREYLKRLRYVADSGCQTIMLTGTSEPQQNKQFLATFALLHQQIGSPFTNIEMQTTGVMLDGDRDYLRFLRNFVGVNTVALSVSSLSDVENRRILGTHYDLVIPRLCRSLKDYGFNIRICCNLTGRFDPDNDPWSNVLGYLEDECLADQVTFRKMYASNSSTPQAQWLADNPFTQEESLRAFLMKHPANRTTMYGANIYDVNGMSVIYDCDCMGKRSESDTLKYLILRPNCHLYSQWDSTASLVF